MGLKLSTLWEYHEDIMVIYVIYINNINRHYNQMMLTLDDRINGDLRGFKWLSGWNFPSMLPSLAMGISPTTTMGRTVY